MTSNRIFFCIYYHINISKLYPTYLAVSTGPDVARTSTMLAHIDILRVKEIGVCALLGARDRVDNTRFQIQQDRAWDVVLVISLVEEHVLAVGAVRCKVLQHALRADTVLRTKLLPKLHPDLVATLPNLDCYYFSRHPEVLVGVRV